MLNYLLFKIKRALLQFACNFIPVLKWRVRARDFLYQKYGADSRFVSVSEVDDFLPAQISTLINSHSNAQFLAFNCNLTFANRDKQTSKQERERERDAA